MLFGLTRKKIARCEKRRAHCGLEVPKQAPPRLFRDSFKGELQRQCLLKFSFKKRQWNGLAKPGHSAARACIEHEPLESL